MRRNNKQITMKKNNIKKKDTQKDQRRLKQYLVLVLSNQNWDKFNQELNY